MIADAETEASLCFREEHDPQARPGAALKQVASQLPDPDSCVSVNIPERFQFERVLDC